MKNNFTFFAMLIVTACASKSKVEPTVADLFPYGVYQHQVEVEVQADGNERHFIMNGVITRTSEKFVVTGLAYGLTAFKIVDDLNGNITRDFHAEPMKKAEPFFAKIYPSLKKIFLVRRNFQHETLNRIAKDENIVVKFEQPDQKSIPQFIMLRGDRFTVKIRMTKYELKGT